MMTVDDAIHNMYTVIHEIVNEDDDWKKEMYLLDALDEIRTAYENEHKGD